MVRFRTPQTLFTSEFLIRPEGLRLIQRTNLKTWNKTIGRISDTSGRTTAPTNAGSGSISFLSQFQRNALFVVGNSNISKSKTCGPQHSRVHYSGLHKLYQPVSLAVRKWRENEKMKRKWREHEEISRSKITSFCRKMLITALLSRMSQKTYQTPYEKIILGQLCCEKAPQVVSACYWVNLTGGLISASDYDDGMECSQPFYSGAITPFIGW